jgi:hypothetical protein
VVLVGTHWRNSAPVKLAWIDPEPEQLSASVLDLKEALAKVHPVASPSNPGLVNLFEELFWRHAHTPLALQNPLVPHGVLTAAGLPPPHVAFDWQVSPVVHALPSLHPAPVSTTGAGHPLAGTHSPTV